MLLTISYSDSADTITPVEPLKPRFQPNSEICLLLIVNNNKYLTHVVENIIFGISVPGYHSRTVESNSLRLYWNFSIFCLLYIHINNNKFIYDEFNLRKELSVFLLKMQQIGPETNHKTLKLFVKVHHPNKQKFLSDQDQKMRDYENEYQRLEQDLQITRKSSTKIQKLLNV